MNDKKRPAGLPDWAGTHPFTPDKKKPAILDPKNDVITVYGSGREKISPRIFASTDKILCHHGQSRQGKLSSRLIFIQGMNLIMY